MDIVYDEKKKLFKLDSPGLTLVLGVFGPGYLLSLYYGPSIPDDELWDFVKRLRSASFSASNPDLDGTEYDDYASADVLPMAYPCYGSGDFRVSALEVTDGNGCPATDLRYVSYEITDGKPALDGLPATYSAVPGDCRTLRVVMKDKVTGVRADLLYTVFEKCPAIACSSLIKNEGQAAVTLNRVYSGCFDFPDMQKSFVHLYGRYGKERAVTSSPLIHGLQGIHSLRGSSSHNHNPFAALLDDGADEDKGVCRGFSLVYSGNYSIEMECDGNSTTRLIAGIEPDGFSWLLEPGKSFQTPELVSVCSDEGLGGMSRAFHSLYGENLIRGKWKHAKRPLLLNSWEGATFDFDDEKLYSFAVKAKDMGLDMLVMDDGWFGRRNDDTNSLGDWYVNENKLKGGLGSLVSRVNALGLRFGIWFEPEMISPDSDLYRAHPDYCLRTPGREMSIGRHQYVLDMTRKDVRDNIFDQMSAVIGKYNIGYVKWDFNRNITEAASALLPASRQRETLHRYILGVYELMGRLVDTYPDLLLENCSGGGGRFDPGMLYYSPQIWCSDNTDPIERLSIQFGTSLVYPASCVGAHVSVNKRAGYETKGNIALWGTFGYELDPNHLTQEILDLVKIQVAEYHKYYSLIRDGLLYRVIDPRTDRNRAAWEFVSNDRSEALMTVVTYLHPTCKLFVLRFKGLDPDRYYLSDLDGKKYSGALLMNAGINADTYPSGDGSSFKIHLTSV